MNRRSIQERFFAKVTKTDGCWVWIGATSPAGYGELWVNGKTKMATRISYEFEYGDSDPKLFLLHKCDNPPCVNPEHLYQGTLSDNMKDVFRRNRIPQEKLRENYITNLKPWIDKNGPPRGEKHYRAKLNNTQALEIYNLKGKKSFKEIGKLYGIHPSTAGDIVMGRKWTHITQVSNVASQNPRSGEN